MRRGTTPTRTLKLPIDAGLIKELRVIYQQDGVNKLIKTKDDFRFEGNAASIKLTQEETFLFDDDQVVKIQARILTAGGDALASNVIRVKVRELLEDEVMT